MEIKELKVKDIKAKPDLMMRDGLDKTLVAQYKETIESILQVSPIKVYAVGDDFILVDGFHRLAATRQAGLDMVNAQIFTGSFQDAHAAACIANLQHGKPLTRSERKRAICQYVKLNVGLSNRLISEAVGVSDVTIMRYRKEMESSGEIELQESRAGKDKKRRIVSPVTQKLQTATIVAVGSEPPLPEPPPPDLYQEWFDAHVLHGDSLEILPTIERKFDLAIVDPPYGITTEKWDLTNKHELLAFTRRWLNMVLDLLKPTGRLYIFWSRQYMFELKPLLDEIVDAYPLHFGGMLVWYFRNVQSQPDSRKRYKLGWEPIFYYYGLDAPVLNFPPTEITGESWKGKGDVQSDVWTFAIPQTNFKKDQRIHPTQKPEELYRRIIETATHIGDSVLDPFGGSGTTAHAALASGRDPLLIEQNEQYIFGAYDRIRPVWRDQNDKTE